MEPTDVTAPAPTSEQRPGAGPATSGAGSQRGRWAGTYLPMVPFFAYVGLFLLFPTVYVLVGAFQSADGSPSLENISTVLREPRFLQAFGRSVQLSLVSALAGAILGGLFAWAVSVGGPGGRLRQVSVAASGVLAQFGGVMLAFAFLATFGFNGLVTILLKDNRGDRPDGGQHVDLRDDRADPRLHLVPDPAHGHRLPARPSTACGRNGGRRPPASAARAGRTGATSAGRSSRRASSAPSCSCSPTRSPPMPRPRRWSARAARSCRSRSRRRCPAR